MLKNVIIKKLTGRPVIKMFEHRKRKEINKISVWLHSQQCD